MTQAYVGLGSNLATLSNDASVQLAAAVQALRTLPDVVVDAVSPLYWTEPQDMAEQPWFANQVVRLLCGPRWTPEELLRALLELEHQLGRVRSADPALRYGPRAIDLDLLLFGTERRDDPHCTLPHPRMMQRAFVLVPLRDVAPEVMVADGKNVTQALGELTFRVQEQNIYQ